MSIDWNISICNYQSKIDSITNDDISHRTSRIDLGLGYNFNNFLGHISANVGWGGFPHLGLLIRNLENEILQSVTIGLLLVIIGYYALK